MKSSSVTMFLLSLFSPVVGDAQDIYRQLVLSKNSKRSHRSARPNITREWR